MVQFLRKSGFGLINMLISGVLLLHAYSMPSHDIGIEYGPMFFPKVILWGWFALASLILLQDIMAQSLIQVPRINYPVFIKAILAIGGICLLLPILGFLPVGMAFFCAYAYILGYRSIKILVVIAIGYCILIWALFNYVLLVPLPEIPFLE